MSSLSLWILIIGVMVASLLVQTMLDRRFNKYSKVPCALSGAEVAMKMLSENGIYDVKVTCIPGKLTDHFDPTTMTVNLSESVYSQRNIAAAAVAAHECGHVIQHVKGYAPIKLRSALVPAVSFANRTVSWILLAGVMLINISPIFLWAGICIFGITTLFSIVTLPVEINASHRAVEWLEMAGVTSYETRPMAVDALKWAAYTYVIAAISSIGTLLYYISIANDRR